MTCHGGFIEPHYGGMSDTIKDLKRLLVAVNAPRLEKFFHVLQIVQRIDNVV